MLKLCQIPSTWIYHFCKPENLKKLEGFAANKKDDVEDFVNFYYWVISVLEGTPAWGVSGVNRKINEITDALYATLTNAKNGTSSAHGQAGKLLNIIKFHKDKIATPKSTYDRCELKPLLTNEEINELLCNM
jgi:hypothetical protein